MNRAWIYRALTASVVRQADPNASGKGTVWVGTVMELWVAIARKQYGPD